MTDYVKSTNFASKDSLATGNPLKIVKGTEIDTEFNNIATAVTSKADLNSPTFIGTPAAPTASAGTNTTQVATTAFVHNEIMAAVYPVGSLYLNATNAINPATLLGFGTWTAFGAGRVPVGFDSGDALFNTAEKTGGSKDSAVISHSHTVSGTTDTQGSHVHTMNRDISSGISATSINVNQGVSNLATLDTINAAGAHSHNVSGTTSTVGSSGTNANVQPYITVYMWKRTA